MKKTLLFALAAALPLFAQDAAPAPAPSVPATAVQPARHHRPQMTEEQKAAFRAKMLEKFDTNKDGQLDDAEKEAMKAEFMKHHQGQPGKPGMHRPHGPRPEARPAAAPCNCGCNEGKPCECGANCKDAKPAAAPCNCGCKEGKPCQCGDNCKAA